MNVVTNIVSSIAMTISAIIASIALVLTYLSYRQKLKVEHAERMYNLFLGTKKDKDIAEFFCLIDYSVNGWYNKGFHKSDYEQILDNTLIQFNHIVYLYDQKLLTKEEFEQYRYEIDKIVHNIDVQRYFFNLYHYSQRVGLSFKFDKLLKYGSMRGIIEQDFFNVKSTNYGEKCLNF